MRAKVSGFSIVRNGVKFDYPFLESFRSLLPLVDELVINVGIGDDDTKSVLERFAAEEGAGKVVLFDSRWPLDDPEKRRGGKILSEQTNLALDRCTGAWCVYLQADEVLHEKDRSRLREAIARAGDRPEIDGLVFDYVHFYGSFDVIQHSRSAYRREVRAIRNRRGIRSVGDAQSFRRADGGKLKVLRAGARVFHYGWVRTPEAMREKTFFMDTLYHGAPKAADAESGVPHTGDNYRYKRFWGLRRFRGEHPECMGERISRKNWKWDFENSPMEWSWKDAKKIALDTIESLTGRRLFEYRSYVSLD
jgi:glycosyltransferase involved in cell wall biosynthesis